MKKVGGILLLFVGIITFIRAIIDIFSGNFTAVIGVIFGLGFAFLGYKLFTSKPKQTPRTQNIQTQNNINYTDNTPTEARPFRTNLVGCKFNNEDGTSRQNNIEKLSIGEKVFLKPYKYKGENAILVCSKLGGLGNLKKELADEFESKIRTGYFLRAEVEQIWPYEGDLYLSVTLWQKQ